MLRQDGRAMGGDFLSSLQFPGSGGKHASPQVCPRCDGEGQLKFSEGILQTRIEKCPLCGGSGLVSDKVAKRHNSPFDGCLPLVMLLCFLGLSCSAGVVGAFVCGQWQVAEREFQRHRE